MSDSTRALGFMELQENITTGPWDKLRLAAKFFISSAAGSAREAFIEAPKAVWHNVDPAIYSMEAAKRNVETTREIGRWAVGQGIISPETIN